MKRILFFIGILFVCLISYGQDAPPEVWMETLDLSDISSDNDTLLVKWKLDYNARYPGFGASWGVVADLLDCARECTDSIQISPGVAVYDTATSEWKFTEWEHTSIPYTLDADDSLVIDGVHQLLTPPWWAEINPYQYFAVYIKITGECKSCEIKLWYYQLKLPK